MNDQNIQLFAAAPITTISQLRPPPGCNWDTTVLTTDAQIGFVEDSPAGKSVKCVNLQDMQKVHKVNVYSKDVLLSPDYVYARDDLNVIISDMESKLLKQFKMPEKIAYWKLVETKRLLVITVESIIVVDDLSDPITVCQRSDPMGEIRDAGISSRLDVAFLYGKNKSGVDGASIYNTKESKNEFSPCLRMAIMSFNTKLANPSFDVMLKFSANVTPTGQLTSITVAQTSLVKGAGNFTLELGKSEMDIPVAIHPIPSMGMFIVITRNNTLKLVESFSKLRELFSINLKSLITNPVIKYAPCSKEPHCFVIAAADQCMFKLGINLSILVPFLMKMDPNTLARIVFTSDLPDSEALINNIINEKFIKARKFKEMAEFGALSYSSYFHNTPFLELLQKVGVPEPIQAYFEIRLKVAELNQIESLFYVKCLATGFIPSKGHSEIVQHCIQLIDQKKLSNNPLVVFQLVPLDQKVALQKLLTVVTPDKILNELMKNNQFDIAITFAKEHNIPVNINNILNRLLQTQMIPQVITLVVSASKVGYDVNLSSTLNHLLSMPQCDPSMLVQGLVNIPDIDKLVDGPTQTRLMERLFNIPQAFQHMITLFTKYSRDQMAMLCQQNQRFEDAFMLYDEILKKMSLIEYLKPPFDWLVKYLSNLSPNECFNYMEELMKRRPDMFRDVVISLASDFHADIGISRILSIFKRTSEDALFFFLKSIHPITQDPEIHEEYIRVCAELSKFGELTQVLEHSNSYRPENVISILKTKNFVDESPMVLVCSKFDMLQELIEYLDQKNRLDYLNVFITQGKSQQMPKLVKALCDMNKEDGIINRIMIATPLPYSFKELFDVLHERQRLFLMQVVVEKFLSPHAGATLPTEFYTVAALFYIETNEATAKLFLQGNRQYSPKEVGDYCKTVHPTMALEAYSMMDDLIEDYIATATEHHLFLDFVVFLMKKKSEELWSRVLDEAFPQRLSIMEQLMNMNFSKHNVDSENIMVLLNVLMKHSMYADLIDVISNILSSCNSLSYSVVLQELIISCAIKSKHPKLRTCISTYSDFDHQKMGSIAETYGAYEEAVIMYKNKRLDVDVIRVLAEKMDQMDRAIQHAELTDKKQSWLELGRVQLEKGMINDSITCYMKAGEYPNYQRVIEAANKCGHFENLMKYLEAVRLNISNDSAIDNEYAMCLVKSDQIKSLEKLLSEKNGVNPQKLGDRCFEEGFFTAARLFYTHVKNYPKLAVTYMKLKLYKEAVDCAQKASQPQTWREICQGCIEAGEMQQAVLCAKVLVFYPREVPILVEFYEKKGLFKELIVTFETAMAKENSNIQIFTVLSILYCKYQPEKVKELIEMRWAQIRLNELITELKNANMFLELSIAYERQKSYDLSVKVMMDYPGVAWSDKVFQSVVVKVNNTELIYQSIEFYAKCYPELLCDFLKAVSNRLDSIRSVNHLKKLHVVQYCQSYLQLIQNLDQSLVNSTLNDLYIDQYDHESLLYSISTFKNFDTQELARKLESHEMVEFRRIANTLYKDSRKFKESIVLAHKDGLVKDAIQYALDSKDTTQVNEVLKYYLQEQRSDAVIALLYVCYDMLQPDDVLELCWNSKQYEPVFPYFVQYLKENERRLSLLDGKVGIMETSLTELKESSRKTASKVATATNVPTLTTPLMISAGQSPAPIQQQQQHYPGAQHTAYMGQPQQAGYPSQMQHPQMQQQQQQAMYGQRSAGAPGQMNVGGGQPTPQYHPQQQQQQQGHPSRGGPYNQYSR